MKDIRDWVDIAFKVVLAVVGVIVGYFFSFQKQQNDDLKLIIDLATATEGSKRLIGVSIAQDYFHQKRISEGIWVAIFKYGNNSGDPKLQAVVNSAVADTSKGNQSLEQEIVKATAGLPVRIYFHIGREEDRSPAQNIQRKVEIAVTPGGNAIIIPGIELVSQTPAKSQLRCFKKVECQTLGPQLIQIFKDDQVAVELTDLSARYESSSAIRPNHFEAWFAALK